MYNLKERKMFLIYNKVSQATNPLSINIHQMLSWTNLYCTPMWGREYDKNHSYYTKYFCKFMNKFFISPVLSSTLFFINITLFLMQALYCMSCSLSSLQFTVNLKHEYSIVKYIWKKDHTECTFRQIKWKLVFVFPRD